MDQQVIEKAVLASLRSAEDLATIHEHQISEESFVALPQVFCFIANYIREFGGKSPSTSLLKSQFGVELEDVEDVPFYIAELKRRELGRNVHRVLERGIDLLGEEGGAETASAYLLAELARVRHVKRVTRSVTDGDALTRFDKYIERREQVRQGSTIGLRTGLSCFDADQVGLKPGNLLGIVGNTNVGKSWLLMHIATTAYAESGARVLFISPEMTVEEVEARWDTLMGRLCGVELSNIGLARGRGVNEDAYKRFVEAVRERKDWITCEASDLGGSFTLSAIEDLIIQTRPDVVAVDGLPLLVAEGAPRAAQWEQLAATSKGLKNLAKSYRTVMIVTNQATREAEGRESMRLRDTGYSYAFVQNCDQVIMISTPTEEVSNKKLISLMKVRVGKVSPGPVAITWDVDRGIIG